MRLAALLLLALPLAAQSPVGTWEAEATRTVQGTEVTDHGAITFRADHTYVAARKWTWIRVPISSRPWCFCRPC